MSTALLCSILKFSMYHLEIFHDPHTHQKDGIFSCLGVAVIADPFFINLSSYVHCCSFFVESIAVIGDPFSLVYPFLYVVVAF